jgi:redox-sensitive bicupin YhaK (pirin superfamily)
MFYPFQDPGSRRTFLKKLGGMLAVLAVPSWAGAGRKTPDHSKKSRAMNLKTVSNVRRLGFQWETADPFLFCVHHEDFFPKGNGRLGPDAALLEGRDMGQDFTVKDGFRMYHGDSVPGFPEHPHRGFETVTVVQRGMVDHADSQGAAGRYGGGDTQWMTAGRGIQHSEMFPLLHDDKDNTLELFQIWLNLPAKHKMVEPHFTMLWSEDIPTFVTGDGKTGVVVVAGRLGNKKAPPPPPHSWASNPENDLGIWVVDMQPGAEWTMPAAKPGVNRALYFFKGKSLSVEGESIPSHHAADLDAGHETTIVNGPEKARLLILQGKPIGEPVAQYGPFVMNTPAEIQTAFADYRATRFGGWPWKSPDPTHGGVKVGRFAKHADGRREDRGRS